jgi:hypothetical protein
MSTKALLSIVVIFELIMIIVFAALSVTIDRGYAFGCLATAFAGALTLAAHSEAD